jgi:uncharacterized protein
MSDLSDEKRPPTCCQRTPPPALLRGIEQFNRREYFECHETLEELWKEERAWLRNQDGRSTVGPGCDTLYKGILQIGVGCYHLLRHNYHGSTVKLQSGADYLLPYVPVCMTVEVQWLIGDAHSLRTLLVALGPDHFTEVDLAHLPKVQLVATAT